jgi:hypothetical protein
MRSKADLDETLRQLLGWNESKIESALNAPDQPP